MLPSMRSCLVVLVVVLLSHHVAASTTLKKKLMASRSAPNCPYGPATYNSVTSQWDCPSTCSDGSHPECLIEPCAATSCLDGQICVDNYCPNYPVDGNDLCTATCVTPANCLIDPCHVAQGQASKCGTGQVCQADYRFGCGFTCQAVTCTYNGETYHVNQSRPADDGCNICSCMETGNWICTKRPCPIHPTTPTPTPLVVSACPALCLASCADPTLNTCWVHAADGTCVRPCTQPKTTTTQPTPTCRQVCTEACQVGFSCQTDANGCTACLPTPTTPAPTCRQVCTEDCMVGFSCQTDANGCKACLPTPSPTPSPDPTCQPVCTRDCAIGFSCQPDANGCFACLPTPTPTPVPQCTSNEGNPVSPGSSFRVRCNACGCKDNGTVGICTLMACDSNKCWDDQGNSYAVGETITRGCNTAICTPDANGQGVWAWLGC